MGERGLGWENPTGGTRWLSVVQNLVLSVLATKHRKNSQDLRGDAAVILVCCRIYLTVGYWDTIECE
jgi:hypothetical protein